jgi:hypothetical protein
MKKITATVLLALVLSTSVQAREANGSEAAAGVAAAVVATTVGPAFGMAVFGPLMLLPVIFGGDGEPLEAPSRGAGYLGSPQ